MFYEQFDNLCRKNGTSPTRFTVDRLHLSSSKVTAWKNGSIPKYEILKQIADCFGVSVGYLFDGEQKNALSENARRIVELFDDLTPTQQGEIIGRAALLAEQNEVEYIKDGA